jgi:hypothetical protein
VSCLLRVSMSKATAVYLVDHVNPTELGDEERLIGIFSTHQIADETVVRLSAMPGFCDSPDRFTIGKHPIDEKRGWAEGFTWWDEDCEGFEGWSPNLDSVEDPVCLGGVSSVFLLQHQYIRGIHTNVKNLGIYSSPATAIAATSRFARQPGFRAIPDGFSLLGITLDVGYWKEGFQPRDPEALLLFRLGPS